MPFLTLALLLARSQEAPPSHVDLYRGASLYASAGVPNYQDVEDTTLDQASTDVQHGGDYTLTGGPNHTILIRFGSLAAALGPNVRIKDAKLVLSATTIGTPRLHSIGALNHTWGEGPFHVEFVTPKIKPPAQGKSKSTDQTKPEVIPPPPTYGATWKSRFANFAGSGWQSPGATAAADATPIGNTTTNSSSNQFEIDGLGPAVQTMLSQPGSNHGFALSFETDTEFFSSECSGGKPRLVVTLEAATDASPGGDLAVESIVPDATGFMARVRNVGTEPVTGLKTTWTVEAREGSTLELPLVISPNQVRDVHLDASTRTNSQDHRLGSVSLRVASADRDHNAADKQLTIYPSGLAVSTLVEQTVMAANAHVASPRGYGLANWVQSQIDIVNDIYLARSRYSFAPEGCLERVRLAELKEIGPLIDGPAPTGIPVEITSPAGGLPYIDFGFIRRLLLAIGAPDLGKSSFSRDSTQVKAAGWNVSGVCLFPDITGGGDTRFDGSLPSQILLPQIAIDDPTLANIPFEANGLLSACAVGILNSLVGIHQADRPGARQALAAKMPRTIFVDAADANGRPFKNVNLDFFQCRAGTVGDQPAFSLVTSDSGAALLPNRVAPGSQVSNPFGSQDLENDGAFLVRASANGEQAWAWIKAWQLQEATFRGDASFASVPIYFTLPAGSVDRSINRAAGRSITGSSGQAIGKLTALVDGQGHTNVELPEKVGDWIELDLNRDWTLGELRLTTLGEPMWQGFQVQVYQTGQKPEAALAWSSEANWVWAVRSRGNQAGDGRTSVTYNGPLVQIRYIRIVCTKPGKGGLAQIEAFSTKPHS